MKKYTLQKWYRLQNVLPHLINKYARREYLSCVEPPPAGITGNMLTKKVTRCFKEILTATVLVHLLNSECCTPSNAQS